MKELVLSPLGHTYFIDIDGTICKHNGYKLDGEDTLLPGVKEFFASLSKEDKVILVTSRTDEYKEATIAFLKKNNISYDQIIFNAPYGERIVINDDKPSGLVTGHAVNLKRDQGLKDLVIEIDKTK